VAQEQPRAVERVGQLKNNEGHKRNKASLGANGRASTEDPPPKKGARPLSAAFFFFLWVAAKRRPGWRPRRRWREAITPAPSATIDKKEAADEASFVCACPPWVTPCEKLRRRKLARGKLSRLREEQKTPLWRATVEGRKEENQLCAFLLVHVFTQPGSEGDIAGRLGESLLCADIVAKVENRTTLKISRKVDMWTFAAA